MAKVILDADPADFAVALNIYFTVSRNNPQQKIGKGDAIRVDLNGKKYMVVRNEGSYTVKQMG